MKKLMALGIMIFVVGCAKTSIITGPKGADGSNGTSCEVSLVAASPLAPNGGSLIQCATSSSLVLNGTNGSNGANGTPGTVISSIALCPGTTVYPSKFVEVAFCMNNELYAVYSQNGGFLTHIPAGTYGSNGINASCNFTVGANCSVNY